MAKSQTKADEPLFEEQVELEVSETNFGAAANAFATIGKKLADAQNSLKEALSKYPLFYQLTVKTDGQFVAHVNALSKAQELADAEKEVVCGWSDRRKLANLVTEALTGKPLTEEQWQKGAKDFNQKLDKQKEVVLRVVQQRITKRSFGMKLKFLPDSMRCMSTGALIGIAVAILVAIVGLILLLVFALGSSDEEPSMMQMQQPMMPQPMPGFGVQ